MGTFGANIGEELWEEAVAVRYISGVHALNLPCSSETTGDWHTSSIQWDNPWILESDGSIFGNYGIETCDCVPEHKGVHINGLRLWHNT